MKEIPDDMVQITVGYGGVNLYVKFGKVTKYAVSKYQNNYCVSPHHETPANNGLRISRP
jgi:hypothetical protein